MNECTRTMRLSALAALRRDREQYMPQNSAKFRKGSCTVWGRLLGMDSKGGLTDSKQYAIHNKATKNRWLHLHFDRKIARSQQKFFS
jgi:hypothetical protein